MKSFYITTTLPYVNAEPHIGFAMELVHADKIARWKQLNGFDVFFNTGTDEHGLKIYQAALIENKTPQAYTDELAQKFWKLCKNAGDIYKKEYKIRYCVGCELEKTDSGLADGRCPIHPNKELEMIEEENYFFRLSKYGPKLLEFYDKNPDFVIPDFRLNEMRALIGRGLEDFSISRLKSKMPWGIEKSSNPL